jgi:hypothetical protein
MPQYYSNSNIGTSFSDGLMAGYEFVDRIRMRREEAEQRKRENDRADRGMNLAEHADTRAEAASERAKQEYEHDTKRRVTTEANEDTDRAFLVDERKRAVGNRDQDESARATLADAVLSSQPSDGMSVVGGGGRAAAPRQTQPGAPAPAGAPAPQAGSAPAPEVPSGPINLRKAQQDADNAPGFIDRLKNWATESQTEQKAGQKKRTAESFWGEVANPKSTVGTMYHEGIGHSVPLREVRLDPAKYSGQYLKDRDNVPVDARASIDMTMSDALHEKQTDLANQIKALDPKDQRNAGKINALTQQLIAVNNDSDAVGQALTKSAAADAGIKHPVKVDDPRVVPAIVSAAERSRGAQEIPLTTPGEIRAATVVAQRAGGGKRVNEKQLAALTTLYKHGQIDAEQLTNWSKYGSPIAPKAPQIQALGGGYAAVVSENGISIMELPQQKGAASAASLSNRRLLNQDRLKELYEGFKGMVDAGELSDGNANQHMNKFLQTVKRQGAALQLKTGIPLFGEDGSLNLADTDPGEIAELLSSYQQFDKGEEQPWVFKGGKSFTDYAPERGGDDEILDLTGAFQ